MFRHLITVLFIAFCSLGYGQFGDPIEDTIDIGVDLLEQDDYQAALKKFEVALSMDKKNYRALYESSVCLLRLGKLKKAIKYCSMIIKAEDPNYMMDAYILKAEAVEKSGHRADAITIYEEAVSRYKMSSYLNTKLGIRYMKMGFIDKAQTVLEKAVIIDENNAGACKALAHVLFKKAYNNRAYLLLLKTLMLDNDDKDALQLLSLVEGNMKSVKEDKDSTFFFTGDILKLDPSNDFKATAVKLEYWLSNISVRLTSEQKKNNLYYTHFFRGFTDLFLQGYGTPFVFEISSKTRIREAAEWKASSFNLSELNLYKKWQIKYSWFDCKL